MLNYKKYREINESLMGVSCMGFAPEGQVVGGPIGATGFGSDFEEAKKGMKSLEKPEEAPPVEGDIPDEMTKDTGAKDKCACGDDDEDDDGEDAYDKKTGMKPVFGKKAKATADKEMADSDQKIEQSLADYWRKLSSN